MRFSLKISALNCESEDGASRFTVTPEKAVFIAENNQNQLTTSFPGLREVSVSLKTVYPPASHAMVTNPMLMFSTGIDANAFMIHAGPWRSVPGWTPIYVLL